MRYLVGGVVLFLALSGAWLATYLGVFQKVEFSQKVLPEFLVLYVEHLGAYHKIVPDIEKVEAFARSHGEKCDRSFGEFMDDPEMTDEDRLRSRVGCLLENLIESLPVGFHIELRNYPHYLVATFRGSPSIGPFKVYPRAKEILDKNAGALAGPPLEIYRILNASENQMETTYLFPLKRPIDIGP